MSCLFDSLSSFFNKKYLNSFKLRNIICDYLIQNPILFDDIKAEKIIFYENKTTLQKYVHNMRQNNTWGGSIEIKSFCNIFNINVIVKNIRDNNQNIEFLSNNKKSKKNIFISWNGSHFEPIYYKKK